MTFVAHDLLRIDDIRRILSDSITCPDWVEAALTRAPWVVVRRTTPHGTTGKIPVGIRGRTRSERHGMWIDPERVESHLRPEQLVAMAYRGTSDHPGVPAMALARAVGPVFARRGLMWGPTGSVGFEWASGVRTAHASSDLDLIVRCDTPLPQAAAAEILDDLVQLAHAYGGCRIDANVETPLGAFSLAEYAAASGAILLRTATGPLLTNDAWEARARR